MKRLAIVAVFLGLAACNKTTTPSNQPPTTGSIQTLPAGAGLQAATTFTFNESGVTDPESDALTFGWDFGDGSTGSGATVTHSFSAVGTFTVKLSANDGHNPVVAAAQTTVNIRTLTATWSGTVNCAACSPTSRVVTLHLTQGGLSLSGTCSDSHNGTGFQPITVQAFTLDSTTGLFTFTGNCAAGFAPFGMKYDPVADTFTVNNWDSPPYNGTLTRS